MMLHCEWDLKNTRPRIVKPTPQHVPPKDEGEMLRQGLSFGWTISHVAMST